MQAGEALSFPVCLFDDEKNALPLFDVCFVTTHSDKGRAMSGKAAKVIFDRDNVHDSDQVGERNDG
jgi:hypothetical protein